MVPLSSQSSPHTPPPPPTITIVVPQTNIQHQQPCATLSPLTSELPSTTTNSAMKRCRESTININNHHPTQKYISDVIPPANDNNLSSTTPSSSSASLSSSCSSSRLRKRRRTTSLNSLPLIRSISNDQGPGPPTLLSPSSLPDEVLVSIFRFISSAATLAKLRTVCKQWCRVIDETPHVWRSVSFYGTSFSPHVISVSNDNKKKKKKKEEKKQILKLSKIPGEKIMNIAAISGNEWAKFLYTVIFCRQKLHALTVLQPLASLLVCGRVARTERSFPPNPQFSTNIFNINNNVKSKFTHCFRNHCNINNNNNNTTTNTTTNTNLSMNNNKINHINNKNHYHHNHNHNCKISNTFDSKTCTIQSNSNNNNNDVWLAIHAARKGTAILPLHLIDVIAGCRENGKDEWPRGAVVGVIHISKAVKIVGQDGQDDRWIWHIDRAVSLKKPLRCAGFVGLWPISRVLTDVLVHAMHNQ